MKKISLLSILLSTHLHSTTITILEPQNYQVYQRQLSTTPQSSINQARVTLRAHIHNSLNSSSQPITEWQITTPDGTQSQWAPITTKNNTLEYTFAALANNGWYQLKIRIREGNQILHTTPSQRFGVGEIFLVAGQSNSANFGEKRQTTQTGNVASFSNGKWQLANDPMPGADGNKGSFMPPLGDLLSQKFCIPIAFVPCGVNQTSIREWLPQKIKFTQALQSSPYLKQNPDQTWSSNGQLITNLTNQMKHFGPNGYRAVLWQQGESDANQPSPYKLPASTYAKMLQQLINSSQQNSQTKRPWFIAQTSYHNPNFTGDTQLRTAQANLCDQKNILLGPNSDTLTGKFRAENGQSIHFSNSGLHALAQSWLNKLSPWIEQQNP